jgi:protein required for attachment to host cells
MTRIMIPWRSWVLVADGAKATVFRNLGDADLINLEVVEAIAEPHANTRSLGSDRPGRVHASCGEARSAVEDLDLHRAAEAGFLGRVAKRLDDLLREHSHPGLVIVAPPRELGVLRSHLTPDARKCVTAEIAKDFVHMTTAEVERRLRSSPATV